MALDSGASRSNPFLKVRVPTDLAPDQLVVTTVRTLSIDGVEHANSGHPGAPMGLAPAAWMLFSRHLRHAPANPAWPNRDRFVLSAGHASMLLYSLLHLSGYDLPMEQLKAFRQLGSETPGHPELGDTPGVEITTGPLGQGVANAVGFALAERMMAAHFNRPGQEVVDHRTWFICSDGDLMEGIGHEAASLAGHLRLDRLIGIYDDNHISLDGPTSLSFDEDVEARFAACGWRVLHVEDGNDLDALDRAMTEASVSDGRPTLIRCRTHIGFGSPNKQDSSAAHGSPLGDEEVKLTKRAYGWPEDAQFLVPDEVAAWAGHLRERGAMLKIMKTARSILENSPTGPARRTDPQRCRPSDPCRREQRCPRSARQRSARRDRPIPASRRNRAAVRDEPPSAAPALLLPSPAAALRSHRHATGPAHRRFAATARQGAARGRDARRRMPSRRLQRHHGWSPGPFPNRQRASAAPG